MVVLASNTSLCLLPHGANPQSGSPAMTVGKCDASDRSTHLLYFPQNNNALLSPVSGSCVDVTGGGHLCFAIQSSFGTHGCGFFRHGCGNTSRVLLLHRWDQPGVQDCPCPPNHCSEKTRKAKRCCRPNRWDRKQILCGQLLSVSSAHWVPCLLKEC